MSQLVECVPNFSEGRDAAVVTALRASIESALGGSVLDTTSDVDHNRTVITFAGSPEAVLRAAVEAAGTAVERIDLRAHEGVHPCIGAIDVLPFVPISGITLAQCATLAVSAGERIWRRWRLPVYLYEEAARSPERRNLTQARKKPLGVPDIGGPGPHPSAGAVAAGARRFLIAYNVNLKSSDLTVAQVIAMRIRASSGGLPAVKALGLPLASQGIVQVSMNLIDFETTPMHVAFQAVCREASGLGVDVLESELIGLVPRRAWELSRGCDLRIRGWDESRILENRLKRV
ncbi:MAG: glutamate formimidoyltransferase [Acidobacteriia bacterium]|nr:glutamate formimidoyltransferase [Terriglobia bacterium]